MNQLAFEEKLNWGETAEEQICKWLNSHDEVSVMRVWAKIDGNRQVAPKIKLQGNYYSTPDIQIFQDEERKFIEVKRMSGWTYYRIKGQWQIGIAKAQYMQYKTISEHFDQQLDMYFLIEGKPTSGTPQSYKSGLFRMNINEPTDHEFNVYDEETYKRVLMVYWNESQLEKIAELDDVMNL